MTKDRRKQSDGFRRWLAAGDSGLIVNFADHPRDKAGRLVRALAGKIREKISSGRLGGIDMDGIEDLTPGLANLLIHINPLKISGSALEAVLSPMIDDLDDSKAVVGRHWVIPSLYDDDYAPDLAEVASRTGLSRDEVIARHTAATLEVAIMGFLPGLAYMKGVDKTLYLPRRKTPRKLVPELSIGIAMDQTVIYPMASPGGWNLIGQVPIKLFDTRKEDPILFSQGDKITFQRIDIKEFNMIKKMEDAGDYYFGDDG